MVAQMDVQQLSTTSKLERSLFFHTNFSLRSIQGQNQWLLEYFNANCSQHQCETTYTYVVCEKSVCKKLWLSILNVSQARYYRVCTAYLGGKVTLKDSRQQVKKQSHRSYEPGRATISTGTITT